MTASGARGSARTPSASAHHLARGEEDQGRGEGALVEVREAEQRAGQRVGEEGPEEDEADRVVVRASGGGRCGRSSSGAG